MVGKMIIRITADVFKSVSPDFRVCCILLHNIDLQSAIKESQHLLHDVEKLVGFTFQKETIKNHHLISPWALAQREFGQQAKHYHTSVEKLIKKVLRKQNIATANPLENVLRYVALKYVVPYGIDDTNAIKTGITFTIAQKKTKKGLLSTLKPGELYCKDAAGPIATHLDYWKAKRTSLTPVSTSALIHFTALPPITKTQLRDIALETSQLLKAFCGGTSKIIFLDKHKSSVKI